jgi:hypothetical protein
MNACLNFAQVNVMRFSAAFQLPLSLPRAAQPAEPAPQPAAAAPTPEARTPLTPDLPDDLDARVRLIGEWQLGEG